MLLSSETDSFMWLKDRYSFKMIMYWLITVILLFCLMYLSDVNSVNRVRENQLRESYVLKYGDKVEGK